MSQPNSTYCGPRTFAAAMAIVADGFSVFAVADAMQAAGFSGVADRLRATVSTYDGQPHPSAWEAYMVAVWGRIVAQQSYPEYPYAIAGH